MLTHIRAFTATPADELREKRLLAECAFVSGQGSFEETADLQS